MPDATTNLSHPTHALPPRDAIPTRLLSVPGSVVSGYNSEDLITDAIRVLDPDAVIAVDPDAPLAAQRLLHSVDVPVHTALRGMGPETITPEQHASDDTAPPPVVIAPDITALPSAPPRDSPYTHLITSTLELTVDPRTRSATLSPTEPYRDVLTDEWLTADVAHLSTHLRVGYHGILPASSDTETTQEALPVYGIGTSHARLGAGRQTGKHDLGVIDCYGNGVVVGETAAPDEFGLRGLDAIGPKRAETLRDAGYTTPEAVADTVPSDIAAIDGFATKTARRAYTAAQAIESGSVIRTTDDSLPHGDPIFIDIETDGLSASVVWLIGVLDGDADTGDYYPFRQRTPADHTTHLEAFLTWLADKSPRRPIVAWNGYGFDFDILSGHIAEHCPEYVDMWEDRYHFDPLYWATTQGNAVLPGRTNKQAHVAQALGDTSDTPGVDGALVARRYTAWRDAVQTADDSTAVPEPDWEYLERYCEDDVRALATIYEAIRAADRATNSPSRSSRSETTSQGNLADFS